MRNLDPDVYQLICDFACKLEGELSIAGQYVSDISKPLQAHEVKAKLVAISGVDHGDNLLAWADWYLNHNRYISDEEKGILYLIRVIGRIRKISGQAR